MKALATFLTLTTLFSCSTTKYSTPKLADNTPSCEVTVFRDSFKLIYSVDIKVSGVAYAKLRNETYATFRLKEGKQTIETSWFPGTGGVDLKVPIDCKNNEQVNVAFFGGVQGGKRKTSGGVISKSKADKRKKTYTEVK